MNRVVDYMIMYGVESDGRLNYVLFKLCLDTVGKEPSYNKLKNFCGELEECVAEIRRRITASYEEEKIRENGDVKQNSGGNFKMTPHLLQQLGQKFHV